MNAVLLNAYGGVDQLKYTEVPHSQTIRWRGTGKSIRYQPQPRRLENPRRPSEGSHAAATSRHPGS